MTELPPGTNKSLAILSQLLWQDHNQESLAPQERTNLGQLSHDELEEMLTLARTHHVVVRALRNFSALADSAETHDHGQWAATVVQCEQARIENALSFLHAICERLETEGCQPIVIKTLDHWPDFGNDLDLFTNSDPARVIRVMERSFNARLADRSWGDRLANKWNFILPELPELVEIHMRRLGQTGEQVTIANSLISRARSIKIGNYAFRVPAPEHRLMICTLQRMYRHFYARLCDFVNTETLLQTETVDYELLRSASQAAGIWEGVATFLAIVSDYIECYRGQALGLPAWVTKAARFRGDQISFAKGFLRVRILPHSATLYASELTKLLRRGELKSSIRLTLLPCLATAAAVGQKITGSDKGIW